MHLTSGAARHLLSLMERRNSAPAAELQALSIKERAAPPSGAGEVQFRPRFAHNVKLSHYPLVRNMPEDGASMLSFAGPTQGPAPAGDLFDRTARSGAP